MLRSAHTLRFEIIHRAGRLLRLEGRLTLRLQRNRLIENQFNHISERWHRILSYRVKAGYTQRDSNLKHPTPLVCARHPQISQASDFDCRCKRNRFGEPEHGILLIHPASLRERRHRVWQRQRDEELVALPYKIESLWGILCQGAQPRLGSGQLPDGRLRVLRQDSPYGLVAVGTYLARLINGSVLYEARVQARGSCPPTVTSLKEMFEPYNC